jgi:hypothetical protein
MAALTTIGFEVRDVAPSKAALAARNRRHRITPEAGRGLEILGHAIDYLADELVHEGRAVEGHDPQVEAIQLLMRLNRKIYFECPLVPTFRERLEAFFHAPAQAEQR